ncbi:MAG: peptidase M17 [Betaproteobacteria bacterium HGW-Betaproteobacteria-11]|nr:MAG: peptidase M17 [Betaproteobacteria bacterium HGW-Betaproteobacteria-11]
MSLPRIALHPVRDFSLTNDARHVLVLVPRSAALPADLPWRASWQALLARKEMKPVELAKTPLPLDLADGRRVVLAMHDVGMSRFEQLTQLRKALMLLLDEAPKALVIRAADADTARDAAFVALVNGVPLPAKKKKLAKPLARIELYAPLIAADLAPIQALARGNLLARELTAMAPNALTPASYRKRIRALAEEYGLRCKEYDFRQLKKMGAGAFCAVAQGSHHEDAAIVHLSWQPKGSGDAKKRVALVGKGICFDTGGHNLKPARYMAGMHEDMNGSAVALALTLAAVEMRLPLALDCWLAIAHNHISSTAYHQNDIVTALDGTTVEVVHTDAEGRMVLADTLTLASREKPAPDLLLDFATLTGSMHTALGTRLSGVFASEPRLAELALAAGEASGERVCLFPLAADYAAALESKVADIKQCTLEGEADHILAALFLQRFTDQKCWLHVDLSASNCSGGLGAVATDITGFGVAWGATLLAQWLKMDKPQATTGKHTGHD